MIKLQITGRHYELDPKVTAYVDKKIGGLHKYAPKVPEITGQVVLELDKSGRESNQCVCEVQLHLPRERLFVREATINMYAAIDICEAKLKTQILRHKNKNQPARNRRQRLWAKLRLRDPFTD